jgi:hypothetical protein
LPRLRGGNSPTTQIHYCTAKQIKLYLHHRYGYAQATQPKEDNMMNREEFEALCRVVAWLEDEENQAIYQGSFRRENNDTQLLGDYIKGLCSTGSEPK